MCEILIVFEDGEILGNCLNIYGLICEFRCDEGKYLEGSFIRICSVDV